MMKLNQILGKGLILSGLLMSLVVEAGVMNPYHGVSYSTSSTIVPGEWNRNYSKAKKYADENNIPLLIFWGNDGCGWCQRLEEAMSTKTFKQWVEEKQIAMAFCVNEGTGNDGEAVKAKNALKGWNSALSEYPYVGVYWKSGLSNGKKSAAWVGRYGNNKDTALAKSFIETLNKYLKNWVPYKGGQFTFAASEGNRYEIESGTQSLTMALMRAATAKNYEMVDTVAVLNSDGKTNYTTTVTWEVGDTEGELVLPLGDGGVNVSGLTDGDKLTVVLNDEKSPTLKTKMDVVFVEKANGADNPYWIGERAAPMAKSVAPALEFGEWTMDLVAAKGLANAENGLVLVGVFGSLWCPDCANTEQNFLGLKDESGENRFQSWAKTNKIALVTIDIPNFKGPGEDDYTSAALLSRKTAEFQGEIRSGLGYQSRKGISEEAALETLKTFQELVTTNTKDGGFHRPEDGNVNRTGVPIFVLLKKDGTVAARFTRFAATGGSPTKDDQSNSASYLHRFNEMIEIANAGAETVDGSEIENNDPRTTDQELSVRGGSASGRLSNADFQDAFRLTGMTGAAKVSVNIASATSDAEVSVGFYQVFDGELKPVGTAQNVKLSSTGVTVQGSFDMAGDSYVLVKGKDITDDSFKAECEKPENFHEFTLTANLGELMPQEGAATLATEAGETYEMQMVKGSIYRLTGVAIDNPSVVSTNEFFSIVETGPVTLKATGDTLTYQKWNPGTIGFVTSNRTVKKTVANNVVKFERKGGTSGKVKVRVSVNLLNTTYFYYDKPDTPRFSVNDKGWLYGDLLSFDLEYGDGIPAKQAEFSIKLDQTASLLKKYYGDGKIVLTAELIEGDIACDRMSYVLSVTDPVKPAAGKVKFVSASPYFAKSYTVYALENESVDLTLARVDAWVGDVSTKFSQPKGSNLEITGGDKFVDGVQGWYNNDDEDKKITVSNLPAGGKSVKLTLAPVSPFKVKSSSTKAVTIVSVSTNAPMFAEEAAAFDVVRYTALDGIACALAPSYVPAVENERITLTKLSGSIPSGLTAKYDAEAKALVFTGAPTAKAGDYTAYYRLNAVRSKKLTVSGLPIKVKFHVVDFAALGGDAERYGAISNVAVTTTRTLSSLAVFNTNDVSRLAGTLTLTLPRTGKASAKYVCAGGTITFSAKNWDAKSPEATDGVLTVTLKANKTGYGLVVQALPDGKVIATLTDPLYLETTFEAYSDGQVWSSKHSAISWRGQYTVTLIPGGTEVMSGGGVMKKLEGGIRETNEVFETALAPRGSGYLVLKMTGKTSKEASSVGNYNSGTMVWSGKLPNGTSVSGSGVLTEGVDEFFGELGQAYLPIFKKTSADRLALLVGIECGACDAGEPTPESCRVVESALGVLGEWSHAATPVAAQASYSMDIHAFGSYYSSSVALTNYCAISYVKPEALDFVLDTEALGAIGYSASYGTGVPMAIEKLKVKVVSGKKAADDTMKIDLTCASNPQKVTLKVNRSTGVLSGTFNLPYELNGKKTKVATWTGVLLPGWGKECTCGESGVGVYLPLVNGGFTFSDVVPYQTTSKGKLVEKTLTIVRGGTVAIGLPE